MGFLKDKMIEDQQAGECPDCGTQCKINDSMESYCPDCDISYERHCTGCGSPTNDERSVCSNCIERAMDKD